MTHNADHNSICWHTAITTHTSAPTMPASLQLPVLVHGLVMLLLVLARSHR